MKPKFIDEHGREMATKRYGKLASGEKAPRDSGNFHENQFPSEQHGAKYDNDSPDNWLRGNKGTDKPGFDKKRGGR